MSSKPWIIYLALALIAMSPALYNGYPLVYSDSGTYIGSGFDLTFPTDRPIFYGLFIRIFSLGWSLWIPIIIQSLILCYSFFGLSKKILPSQLQYFIIPLFAFLSFTTHIGWCSSQLMPDVFTSSFLLLLASSFLGQKGSIPESILIIFCLIMHSSHLPIYLGVLFFLFLIKKISHSEFIIPWKNHLIIFSSGLLLMLFVNGLFNQQWKIAPGSHIFSMARMVDNGILEDHLKAICPSDSNGVLCPLLKNFPENSRQFIWNGPLKSKEDWKTSQPEYQKIFFQIFTTPKYLLHWTKSFIFSGLSQLFQNSVGSGLDSEYYRDATSPPHVQVARHFPLELKAYQQSRQNKNLWGQSLQFEKLSMLQYLLIFLSWILLLIYFQKLPKPIKAVVIILIIGIISNAFITGGLANIYDRLQSRVSWLWVFLGAILLLTHYQRQLINFAENSEQWMEKK